MMMEAVRISETSVDNYFTRQYIPEDNSELHTRRRENFKSHICYSLAELYVKSARLNFSDGGVMKFIKNFKGTHATKV
jgi:hypothetical protein